MILSSRVDEFVAVSFGAGQCSRQMPFLDSVAIRLPLGGSSSTVVNIQSSASRMDEKELYRPKSQRLKLFRGGKAGVPNSGRSKSGRDLETFVYTKVVVKDWR